MTEESTELARTAASIVVAAAGTELWQDVRERVIDLFDADPDDAFTERLDTTAALAARFRADDRSEACGRLLGAWSARFRLVQGESPENAERLGSFVEHGVHVLDNLAQERPPSVTIGQATGSAFNVMGADVNIHYGFRGSASEE